jgi:O-antigen/teichoic acid export membrane protein
MNAVPQQVLTVLSGRVVIRIAQFCTFVLLARILTPGDFGWFGIVTTALVLAATLGSLGFRQSLAYQVGQGKMSAGEAVGSSLFLWPLFTIPSAAVVIVLYGDRIPSLSGPEGPGLILVGVAGTMLLTLIQGAYLGRGKLSAFTLSESLPRVLLLLAVVLLVLIGGTSLSSALWAHVGSFVMVIPLAVFLACKGAGSIGIRFDLFRPMLGYGLIFALNLFLITLGSRLAIFIIEHHVGAAEAGKFFAAVRVHEIFLEAATAVGMVLFSNAARQEPGNSVLVRNARIACWMFWLFLALALVIIVAAPVLVRLMLGPAYADAAPALQILALGLAPAAASKVIYPSLAGSGFPHFGTPAILTGLSINLALAVILVPAHGVSGGAMAVVAGQFVIYLGYVITCGSKFQVGVRTMLLPQREDLRGLSTIVRSRSSRRPQHGEGHPKPGKDGES